MSKKDAFVLDAERKQPEPTIGQCKVYMNNAATGFPKFPEVIEAVKESMEKGMLSSRDSVTTVEDASFMFSLRSAVGSLIGAKMPHEICFTCNDTLAMNMLILGMGLKSGDSVLVDCMAHNSLARPAAALARRGVRMVTVGTPDDVKASLKDEPNIKAAFISHASNVTGDVMDIESIGEILYSHGIPFVVDAAQTIGIIPINVEKAHISALAFAGHKGLNGPQGTGGFYIRKTLSLDPIIFGGTGTESFSLLPETVYPDSFEVGTPAMHDLMGLKKAIETVLGIGIGKYAGKMNRLAQEAYDGLDSIKGVTVYGSPVKKVPVVSFNIKGFACKKVGDELAKEGFICRTGMHCASMAMTHLGVMEEYGGTVRVSFGWYNEEQHVQAFLKTVRRLCGEFEAS